MFLQARPTLGGPQNTCVLFLRWLPIGERNSIPFQKVRRTPTFRLDLFRYKLWQSILFTKSHLLHITHILVLLTQSVPSALAHHYSIRKPLCTSTPSFFYHIPHSHLIDSYIRMYWLILKFLFFLVVWHLYYFFPMLCLRSLLIRILTQPCPVTQIPSWYIRPSSITRLFWFCSCHISSTHLPRYWIVCFR